MMLRDLDGFRGSSRRPWVVVVVVILCTLGGVWLIRQAGRKQAVAEVNETASDAHSAAVGTDAGAVRPQASAVKPPPDEATTAEVSRLLARAQASEKSDRLCEARTNYLALITRKDCAAARPFIEARLAAVNIALVTTPRVMPGKIDYAIRAGDSIKVLARRYGCAAELIVKANNIPNPDRIQIGDRIRILEKPQFAIVIRKKANDLLLTLNGAFFKRYTVGTGKYGRTPVGTFRVQDKIENPPWWRPDGHVVPFGDPENILGTRWLSLEATGETPPARGYGIHGTWDTTSLGKQSSAGCIRMANPDVEELYMLVTQGAPVTIVD